MLQCGDLNTPRQPHCPCRGSSEKVFIRNIPAEKSTACSRSTSTSTAVLRCAATAGSGCLSSQLKCEDTHTGTPAGCSEQWSPKKCLVMMSEDLRAHPCVMFPSVRGSFMWPWTSPRCTIQLRHHSILLLVLLLTAYSSFLSPRRPSLQPDSGSTTTCLVLNGVRPQLLLPVSSTLQRVSGSGTGVVAPGGWKR
jgi:hypothetical protein